MEDTGRIQKYPLDVVRRLLLEGSTTERREELHAINVVDRAHVVMLAETGVVSSSIARRLLSALRDLAADQFRAVADRPAPRGTFLMYEEFLIERCGAHVGGVLQTARSRNDLKATTFKLQLRKPYLRMVREALGLQAVLLRAATRHAGVTMPIYTHYQAALPGTFGHYLGGVAAAISRDLHAFLDAGAHLEESPLGAGAGGGTEWPIDPQLTAVLLGFRRGPLHSLDAVASRDVAVRLLAAAAIYATTLSRIATDFLLWTTAEFGFVSLPDGLVGSSSAMPQKRNPFILEHVRGRSAAIAGALVTALTGMHGAPFTNSIDVHAEALRGFWNALGDVAEMTVLLRVIIAGASPNRAAMITRADAGFTVASFVANRLVERDGLDFRTAHRVVGQLVSAAVTQGTSLNAVSNGVAGGVSLPETPCDVGTVSAACAYGGGPSPSSLATTVATLRTRRRRARVALQAQERHWQRAEVRLNEHVDQIIAGTRSFRKAAFFFCLDAAKDPVASQVWEAVIETYHPVPAGMTVDERQVLSWRDDAGNELLFAGTDHVVNERWSSYLPVLRREFSTVDLAGVVNWHEGANAPDEIFTVHTNGDVMSGRFGPSDPVLTRALLVAIEQRRRTAGLDTWSTLVEATHWAGAMHGVPAPTSEDYPVPLVDVEIGSTPSSWSHRVASQVMAQALGDLFQVSATGPTFVGVGGRHFEPAFTEAVIRRDGWAVGHVLPTCWLQDGGYDSPENAAKLRECVNSVRGGVSGVAYHASLKSSLKTQVREFAVQNGLRAMTHRELRAAAPAN